MKKPSYLLVLSALFFVFIFNYCKSTTQMEDGFVINGTVTDASNGQAIPSVKIYVGYIAADSSSFIDKNIVSDNYGKYKYYGGPGTAPGDEVLRFVQKDYYTKDVVLKNSAAGKNSDFTLSVSMQKK